MFNMQILSRSSFFYFFLFFLSCNSSTNQELVKDKSVPDSFVINLENSTAPKTQVPKDTFAVDTLGFRNEYNDEIMLDTIVSHKNLLIEIKHYLTNVKYILPNEFNQSIESPDLKYINKTETKILIKGNNNLNLIYSINSDSIINHLGSDQSNLKNFGVLLISKELSLLKDELSLNYSFSIPYSDIGISVVANLNLSRKEVRYIF
jgi:hypothetical protein